MKKLILAIALLSPGALYAETPNAFDFTYKNKGGYVIDWAKLEFITVDGETVRSVRETQIDGQSRWEWQLSNFSAQAFSVINSSSNPNYLRAKLSYRIQGGEKENCSQTFNPQMEAPIWVAWSKGTTTLKNRCRTKSYMLVPYQAPDYTS